MDNAFNEIMKYCDSNQTIFEELSAMCIDNKIVPYIGAGLSQFAGNVPTTKGRNLFPGWKELIKIQYHANFLGKKLPNNLIVAAQDIEDEIGRNKLSRYIHVTMGGELTNEEWDEILEESENQAISFVPKLFLGSIITTNFDRIIEKKAKDISVELLNVEESMRVPDYKKRVLYKIHGCVDKFESIVLTKENYSKAYDGNGNFKRHLTKFFQGFNFLFLGCSLDIDDETKDKPIEVWETLTGRVKRRDMYHYAIVDVESCKAKIKSRRKELEDRNIHPILFEKGKYESVKIILAELLSRNSRRLKGSNADNEIVINEKIPDEMYSVATLKYNEHQKNIAKNILEQSTINF